MGSILVAAPNDSRSRTIIDDLSKDALAASVIKRVKEGAFGPGGLVGDSDEEEEEHDQPQFPNAKRIPGTKPSSRKVPNQAKVNITMPDGERCGPYIKD